MTNELSAKKNAPGVQTVAVFCGSRTGDTPDYAHAVERLTEAIASGGMGVVYGGGSVGLMGTLADSARKRRIRVTGVMPELFVQREVAHPDLDEFIITQTMQERKQKMLELSDAAIALPGGIGTLDEIVDVVSLSKVGEHRKPIGLLNTNGFYDPLVALFTHMQKSGFLDEIVGRLVFLHEDPSRLLEFLEEASIATE